MPYVEVWIDNDPDNDLGEYDSEELVNELKKRDIFEFTGNANHLDDNLIHSLYIAKTAGTEKEFNNLLNELFLRVLNKKV